MSGSLLRVVDGALGGSLRCGSGGTPPGALVGGKVMDVAEVGGALRQLLARAEMRETRAMIAVSDAMASFKVITFPPSATDDNIESAAAREYPFDPERMATRWVDVHRDDERRVAYTAMWDRALVKKAADAARSAGLEPTVVELKSACVARAVGEPSCVLLDMSTNPVDVFLIDGHVPQLWHSFELSVGAGDDMTPVVVGPLRQVLQFNARRRHSEFKPSSPILIAGEQVVPDQVMANLSRLLGHPVQPLPPPPRVPADVRHSTYLACLGMLMRRAS
jgi:hypothetical protein